MVRVVSGMLAFSLLAASALPLFNDRLRKPGWERVPDAWYQAAGYLERVGASNTIILPGAGFGQQWWGWTIDEPFQGVARTPWTTRSQVPLIPGPSIRFLDSIEDRVESGVGSVSLGDVLARAGVSHVLLRRDLDVFAADAPRPDRAESALRRSQGLELERSFGRSGFGDQAMIDVFRVKGTVRKVDVTDASSTLRLAGGSEDIFTALESGLLERDVPTVVGGGESPSILGDGYRRQERQFGRLHDSLSQVMTADEPYRLTRAEHDYAGVPGQRRVVAEYGGGVRRVDASTSSGYVDAFGAVRPELGPASAIDGQLDTYWRSAPFENPVGQWLEIRFDKPTSVSRVQIDVAVDGQAGLPVERLRVDAGSQSKTLFVDPRSGQLALTFDGSAVQRLRITVVSTRNESPLGVVAVREVAIAGLKVRRHLVVPDEGATSQTGFLFRSTPPRRACVNIGFGPACSVDARRPSPEQAMLARKFTTTTAGRWLVQGSVVARSAPEASALLGPLGSRTHVVADSVYGDDPSVSGVFAFDDDVYTPWLAGAGDIDPELHFTWSRPRTLTRLLVESARVPATRPAQAVLIAGNRRRVVDLGASSLGFFEPLTTNKLTIRFVSTSLTDDASGERRRVGVGEVRLAGAEGSTYAPQPFGKTGARCGLGPELVIDGVTRRTEVTGTLSDVMTGAPLGWRVCDGPVSLRAGVHEMSTVSTFQFTPHQLTLVPLSRVERRARAERSRNWSLGEWGPAERSVQVGPGPEAVLRVAENANQGWQARLDGQQLKPMTLDGWQQGFVIPAGQGGSIALTYAPDPTYRAALVVGLVAALLLLVGVGLDRRAGPHRPSASPARGGVESAALRPRSTSRFVKVVLSGALLATSWLLCGPVVLVGVLLGVLAPRAWSTWVVVLGGLGVAASAAVSAASEQLGAGIVPLPADAAAATAFGLLVATNLRCVLAGETGSAARKGAEHV